MTAPDGKSNMADKATVWHAIPPHVKRGNDQTGKGGAKVYEWFANASPKGTFWDFGFDLEPKKISGSHKDAKISVCP